MMQNNAPGIVEEPTIINLNDPLAATVSNAELDLEMMEIEEAKKHFEDHPDTEAFWAGRLLADRKSTRIAA